jgi:hypothetical protein
MHESRSPRGTGLDDTIANLHIAPELRELLRRCLLPMKLRPSAADVASALATALEPVVNLSPASLAGAESAARLPASAYLTEEEDVRAILGLDRRWKTNPDWLTWARAQVTAPRGRLGDAARALRLVATWLETHSGEWITEDDALHICRVVIGLDGDTGSPSFNVDKDARKALSTAVANGWLRRDEYDDWRPGMPSGSGRKDRYGLTPLGKKILMEVGYSPKPSEAMVSRER